jgi:L-fuconolactonase
MPIVDSHCHVSPVWYGPADDLIYQMERNGVDGAILIQIQHEFNNDYQHDLVRRHPGRFASVVVVDTRRPDAPQELERQASLGASGVRLQTWARSPGDDPLLIWRTAERLGLPVSCIGPSGDFASDEFAALVGALPGLRIVVEHLGEVKWNAAEETPEEVRERIWALSRFPNTFIKIPGLGEFCRRALPVTQPFPFVTPIPDYLERVYRAFGARRMMWGSDFPPVSSREGYEHALKLVQAEFRAMPGVTDEDREWIFGRTAASVFALR